MTFPSPKAGPLLVADPDLPRWRRNAEAAGWRLVDARSVPDDPWLLTGRIVCTDDEAIAALALARGGGAVLTKVDDGGPLRADARRMGATVWPDDAAAQAQVGLQDADVLLEQLAAGRSVSAAARAANVSLRTAQRRLGELREKYGVRTTAGVVTAWLRERR